MPHVRFNFGSFAADERFATWRARYHSQPNWVWKFAFAAGALVVVVPLVLLTLTAVMVFAIVFLLLGTIHRLGRLVGGLGRTRTRTPADDGRRNVRVVSHDQ